VDWEALIPSFEDAFGAETSQADYRRITSELADIVLESRPGTKHDAQILVVLLELQPEI
jgi:hypothetical protein